MRHSLSIITVALLLFSWSATAAIPQTKAQQTITKIGNREPLKSCVWGLLAVTMSGDTIACVNPRQKMVPASNIKLLTTGIALRLLREEFRFETKLGYTGIIEDGVLLGDLYIVGGGDPSTGSNANCAEPLNSLFASWKAVLDSAGIYSIKGRIIGDQRFYGNSDPISRGWTYEDIGTYYGIGPSGLNFYDNKQNYYVTPGPSVGTSPFVRPRFPETPWMQIVNVSNTGKERTANDLYYIPSEFGPYAEIRGNFPIDRKGYTLECSNKYGAYTCAFYFYKYLNNNGIPTEGYGDVSSSGLIRTDLAHPGIGSMAASLSQINIIGSSYSPSLSDIVKQTNIESDNFYAEALFKMIGKKGMRSAVADSCQSAANKALAGMGLKVNGNCQIFDGSGLSRKNYVSPAFFVAFLRIMGRASCFDTFFNSLPIAGKKGTLEHRFNGSSDDVKKRVHAKTGSMNGIRCLSGYIEATNGSKENMIVFSLMTNNCISSSWTANLMIDDMIEALAAEN